MTKEKQNLTKNISELYKIMKITKEKLEENRNKFESIMETLKKWNIEMAENEEKLKKYEKTILELNEELEQI